MRVYAPTSGQVQAMEWRLSPRWRLLWRVMSETGLRVSDALAITVDAIASPEVDAHGVSWISVHERKTRKMRRVRLRPDTIRLMMTAAQGHKHVFYSPRRPNQPVSRSAAWRAIKRASIGADRNVGPHSARKCYAQDIYNATGDLVAVQRALRHSSAAVSALYLAPPPRVPPDAVT